MASEIAVGSITASEHDEKATAGEVWATRLMSQVPSLLRKVPFTVSVVVITIVIGIVAQTIWSPINQKPWFPEVAYGIPALLEGRWWTLFTTWFFALTPDDYITATVVFALLVGASEIQLGTLRTAAVCLIGHVVGLLGFTVIILLLAQTDWPWAQQLAMVRDVGFTTGMLTAVAVASATLRSPWRLRVRAILWSYITVAFLFEGTLADVTHFVAVGLGLLFGQWRYGVEPGFGPRTRRETRLLAFGGLLLIGAVELTVLLFPGHGPLGSTAGQAAPAVRVAIDLVVIVVLANQLRRGMLWAWWGAVIMGAANMGLAVYLLIRVINDELPNGAPVAFGSALLWIGELTLLLLNVRAFRVPLRRRIISKSNRAEVARERARELLTRLGGSTMSWMTLWPENSYYLCKNDCGYVAYQKHAGTAIALADPVVAPGAARTAIGEFAAVSERSGAVPCLFSISEPVARQIEQDGWRIVQIAEDTIIDLPGLEFKGKSWQDIRSAINKAQRESLEFRLVALAEQPFAVLAQVRAISEQWVGQKGLPEMGFTLGGVEEALDPAVRVGLVVDGDGSVHGVTSWLPVCGPAGGVRGWTLDVMRRRPGGFRPVVEYMVASACLAFQETGAEFVSLSGAPLARTLAPGEDLPQVDKALHVLGGALEPLYGFRSLHTFKAKFKPRYEPVYLAYRDEADLPRIGVALTRAYLPGVSARHLVRISLARREDEAAHL